jgi:hypothetical protein
MMKYFLITTFVCSAYATVAQNTYHVTVQVSQQSNCPVVSATRVVGEPPEIYPNPAAQVLHITALGPGASVEMRDQLGRQVFMQREVVEKDITLDIGGFAPGILQIIIRYGNRVYNSRVSVR